MVIETSKFEVTSGDIKTFEFVGGSGSIYDIHSCKLCGTSIIGRPRDAVKNLTYVRSGTLKNTKDIRPLAHIFVQHKQDWVILPEDTPKFEEMYDLEKTWPAESLQRLQAT
jgi:hypothetical protein